MDRARRDPVGVAGPVAGARIQPGAPGAARVGGVLRPDGAGLVQIDVRADDSGQSPQHDAHEGSQHCPFCRNQQADIGILPDPAPLLPASLARKVSYPRSTTSRPGAACLERGPARARRPPDRPRLMHRARAHAREPRLTAPPLPLPIDPPFRGRSARVLVRSAGTPGGDGSAVLACPTRPRHRAAAAPGASARHPIMKPAYAYLLLLAALAHGPALALSADPSVETLAPTVVTATPPPRRRPMAASTWTPATAPAAAWG